MKQILLYLLSLILLLSYSMACFLDCVISHYFLSSTYVSICVLIFLNPTTCFERKHHVKLQHDSAILMPAEF